MPFEFGDIILVRFPFTNQQASKQRPAVIISSREYNDNRPDLVMMAITSQLRPSAGFGETWLISWEAAGLLKPSAIKPVLATIEQKLVIKQLGTLQPSDNQPARAASAHPPVTLWKFSRTTML